MVESFTLGARQGLYHNPVKLGRMLAATIHTHSYKLQNSNRSSRYLAGTLASMGNLVKVKIDWVFMGCGAYLTELKKLEKDTHWHIPDHGCFGDAGTQDQRVDEYPV